SSYSSLSLNEVFKIHEWVDKGHEVAGHGLNHLSAVKISDSLGVDEYLNMEIYPMLDLMEKDGFNVKSFAYPGGSNNKQTDEALLGIFGTLRGVGWSTNYSNAIRKSFFEGFPVVYSFGIDEHKSYFAGLDYNQCILEALTYARDNNKILLVHGHETVETVTDEYQTSFATLDMICNFIIENNMKFYTLSELKGMVNQ
ncbi:MAG: hypothetical protein KFF73_00190, partial [Cyclobacteriaceae bacterium]|nr:hypothetical protein [Cyclobacteriaceae bacterium]